MSIQKILELQAEKEIVEKKIKDEVVKTFKVGSTAHFQRGNSKRMQGEVLLIRLGGRSIKIMSETGKEYWLDLYHFLHCDK